MHNKYISNYFFLLFSIIPISLILGASVSLFNILLIDISFLFLIIYLKDFSFLRNRSFQYLIALYIYLIFNNAISVNQEIGLARNLGFIRIIILFVAINYFFQKENFLRNIFYVWSFIILVVLLDVLLESFTGKNIFGYGSEYGRRVVSFFKDEPIVGGYLNAFYLVLIGFLHLKFGKKYKNFILFFSILILFSILLTGERSNLIKAVLGIYLFYIFFREYQIKHKFYLTISGLIILISIITNSKNISIVHKHSNLFFNFDEI